MELDDLKPAWKREDRTTKTTTDMTTLIHQKSRSPLASLQKGFRTQRIMFTTSMVVIVVTFSKYLSSLSSYIFFWTYIGLCLFVIAAFAVNSMQVRKMERMDNSVRENLERQVTLLEQRLNWQGILVRMAIILFIVLLEVIPHFQYIKMLNTWHDLPIGLRFLAYAGYLTLQYFLSRYVRKRKFGRHLDHLKALLQEVK